MFGSNKAGRVGAAAGAGAQVGIRPFIVCMFDKFQMFLENYKLFRGGPNH